MVAGAISNVLDYGAVGDGVADDTAAIQAAINANYQKALYFPSGTYRITSALELNQPINMFGEKSSLGSTGSKITSEALTCFHVTAAIGGNIDDLQFEAANVGGSPAKVWLFDSGFICVRLIFNDCTFNGPTNSYGVYLECGIIECFWNDCVFDHILYLGPTGGGTGLMNVNGIRGGRINASATPSINNSEVLTVVPSGNSQNFKIDTVNIERGAVRIEGAAAFQNVNIDTVWVGDASPVGGVDFTIKDATYVNVNNLLLSTHNFVADNCNHLNMQGAEVYSLDLSTSSNVRAAGITAIVNTGATNLEKTSSNFLQFEGSIYKTGYYAKRVVSVVIPEDGAAGDTYTLPVMYTDEIGEIKSIAFIPDDTIASDGTNYATIIVRITGLGTNAASFNNSSTSYTANAAHLPTITAAGAGLSAGSRIIFEKQVTGTGTQLPRMNLVIEYEDRNFV